ncbi:hypothetical protein N0V86_009803 [Didymella sp. IMI 355093]|nr:hypothetical protein N0V86_009803 [Didymella sp. IMI 355093]
MAYERIPSPPSQTNIVPRNPIEPVGSLENLTNGGHDIYLTSRDDITSNPSWLDGADINALGGADRTGAIIIVEKGDGVVDVFYFMFWAFNYGGQVLGQNLAGNHVGDWEHIMIRFKGGRPRKAWLSQHANGEAYTFDALEKDSNGRPLLYIAKGSHAIYARQGDIDHTIPNFNTNLPFLLVDQCKAGPRFDPLLSSYVYAYDRTFRDAVPGQFKGLNTSSLQTGWLFFEGHWGDQEYPASDKRQKSLVGFLKYVDGPTGPTSKQLDRKRVWPDNSYASGQLVRTSLDGSTRCKDQLKELWWRGRGGKKIKGKPNRVYTDGTAAPPRKT